MYNLGAWMHEELRPSPISAFLMASTIICCVNISGSRTRRSTLSITSVVFSSCMLRSLYVDLCVYCSNHTARTQLLSSIQRRRRRRCRAAHSLLLPLLRGKRIVATHKHAAHHVEHRVALAGDLDTKIHFADLRQGLVPLCLLQVAGVV